MFYLQRITENKSLGDCDKIPLEIGAQTLGRLATSTIRVKSIYCSEQHAQLIVQPDGVFIKDVSNFGTFVGETRLKKHRLTPLAVGTKIGIGCQVAVEHFDNPKVFIFCLHKEAMETIVVDDDNDDYNSFYRNIVTLTDSESDMEYVSDIDQYFEEVDLTMTSSDYNHIGNPLETPPKESKGSSGSLLVKSYEACENNNNYPYESSSEESSRLDAAIKKVLEKTPPMKRVNILDPLDSRCNKGRITIQTGMSLSDKQLLRKRLKLKTKVKPSKTIPKLPKEPTVYFQETQGERVMAEKRKKTKLSFDDLPEPN